MKVNVKEAGNYKLSVYYSNNEPAPVMKKQNGENYVHPYNTDLVERYTQIAVNGGAPQTVYFRNTFCWDVYKNMVVDVTLEAGDNSITFTNDNSYKFSDVQDDFAPRFDKFEIAPAVLKGTGQTPPDPEVPEPEVPDPEVPNPEVPENPEDPIKPGEDSKVDSGTSETGSNGSKAAKTGDSNDTLTYGLLILLTSGCIVVGYKRRKMSK